MVPSSPGNTDGAIIGAEDDAVIELLGVGVQDGRKAWLFRKACARFDRGTLSVVVAGSPAPSAALLDAVTGRRIPDEGRIWVTRLPLMRESRGRVRALVREATPAAVFVTNRSILWNTLVARGTVLAGLMRVPRRGREQAALHALAAVGLERRARDPLATLSPGDRLRVAVARMLARGPAALVLRDVDAVLGPEDAGAVLCMVRRLARSHRMTAVVSLASIELARQHADQVLVLADGALEADRRALELHAAWARGLESVVR
jgi:ABC-type polar amino acid transport system ATPase subunit